MLSPNFLLLILSKFVVFPRIITNITAYKYNCSVRQRLYGVLSIAVFVIGGCATNVRSSENCVAPRGMGSPSTIEEVVDLLDRLNSPVTVPCIVEALDRPLAINSTRGLVSAQPAESVHNPRIFILLEGVTLSIVPAGRGSELLEIGQYFSPSESLKAELYMPIATPVSNDDLYGHLRYNESITVCGLCHRDEYLATEVGHPNAYISTAYKPLEVEQVPLDAVRAEHESCNPDETPERCEIYSAIFDNGKVVHQDFPEEQPFFY
jgi:hypothetical protein